MTEKRFIFVKNEDCVEDTLLDICYNVDGHRFDYKIVDLLNNLNDKCEFLEIENESLEDGTAKYAELYHESLKENEQLKSIIKKAVELLSEEVDLSSDEAVEYEISTYIEYLKELEE